MTSDVERRLRWLESRVGPLRRRLDTAADRIGKAYQDLTLARQLAAAAGGPCLITIAANVIASGGTQTAGLVGATVTVKRTSDQVQLATGTTDASGNVTLAFTDPAPSGGSGTYDLTASKPPRWAATTLASQVVTCGGTASPTLTLAPASGYVLCGECAEPIPTILHLTDPNGPRTLTWNGVSVWIGCYLKTGVAGESWNGSFCGAAQVQVAIGYALNCPTGGTGKFRLTQSWSSCLAGHTLGAPGVCTANQAASAAGSLAVTVGPTALSAAVAPNATPLNVSFTVTGSNTNGTVTITE